ncbi:protein-L-isoaspartate O-methyltransferase [Comamonadaceae bacterium M7527]|nr:protein-L-isoaspartate O-methyltransferase [Comamonadaceae bacterium M7527]
MSAVIDIEQARFNMIEQQIRPWNVLDKDVLAILGRVLREQFVPSAHKALAFSDLEVPLAQPSQAGLCMLAPRVEARLLQDLHILPTDTVLEIGTGSGYMAALLAYNAKRVITVENNQSMAANARDNLEQANVHNVELVQGDGSQVSTWSAFGPFDVIVLSGSVAAVPQAFLQHLKPGGRLAAICGQEPVMQATLVVRGEDGAQATFSHTTPWETVAPRLQGFDEPSGFTF